MRPAILILAAGRSSRMRGADKLLQIVDGAPLVQTMALRALAAGVPVLVCVGPSDTARIRSLDDLAVQVVEVADADTGMAASFRAGVKAAGDVPGLMILPGDMPGITTQDMQKLINVFQAESGETIVRGAGADGTPGHPVIFPARCFSALSRLTGDSGAKSLLQGNDVALVPLPDRRALVDLDTPEDWATWRAENK